MSLALLKRSKRRCGTCRHYQQSPLREQGWCRNPELRGSQERALVTIDEHRCARMLVDHWQPAIRRRATVQQADAAPEIALAAPPVRLLDTSGGRWVYWVAGVAVLAIVVLLVRLATFPTMPAAPILAVTPVVSRSEAATATPAAPAATMPTFVRVVGVGNAGVPLRTRPAASASGEVVLSEGGLLEVIGDDVQAEGRTWRNLKDDQGRTGWVPAEQLQTKNPLAAESTTPFVLRSEPRQSAKRIGDIPAGARLVLVDSRAGEVVDRALPLPAGAKWYWLKVVGTGETGWAYAAWVRSTQ